MYSTLDNESAFRTVIGRSYYSAFLSARNKANINSAVKDGHKAVVSFYQSKNDLLLVGIGNRLDTMRVTRANADYDCDLAVTKREAGKSLKLCEDILGRLGVLNKN